MCICVNKIHNYQRFIDKNKSCFYQHMEIFINSNVNNNLLNYRKQHLREILNNCC